MFLNIEQAKQMHDEAKNVEGNAIRAVEEANRHLTEIESASNNRKQYAKERVENSKDYLRLTMEYKKICENSENHAKKIVDDAVLKISFEEQDLKMFERHSCEDRRLAEFHKRQANQCRINAEYAKKKEQNETASKEEVSAIAHDNWAKMYEGSSSNNAKLATDCQMRIIKYKTDLEQFKIHFAECHSATVQAQEIVAGAQQKYEEAVNFFNYIDSKSNEDIEKAKAKLEEAKKQFEQAQEEVRKTQNALTEVIQEYERYRSF